ncbi:hypothetical protein Golomagni_01107 [Golovinomyces magnicellulatus]|nr:hypothetical protein Golomagni_01107 [Golovinomyces magnicellulatus]
MGEDFLTCIPLQPLSVNFLCYSNDETLVVYLLSSFTSNRLNRLSQGIMKGPEIPARPSRERSDSTLSDPLLPVSRQRLQCKSVKTSSVLEADESAPLLEQKSRSSRIRLLSPTFYRSSHYGFRNAGSFRKFKYNRNDSCSGIFASNTIKKISAQESKSFIGEGEHAWYDQFTSTDWVRDSIADSHRVQNLKCRKDIIGRLKTLFDGCEGWILSALVGFAVAIIAFIIDVAEPLIFDWKEGYCSNNVFASQKNCCLEDGICDKWKSWSELIQLPFIGKKSVEFTAFVFSMTILSTFACLLTLMTKTTASSSYQKSSLNEYPEAPKIYYPAAGSGVPEVRVILSGFVFHGFLGVRTLVIKSLALILGISSGLSIGKEGPFVHIGTCVGNVACRLFSKYNKNDGKLREVLSAGAAAGVAVAFGAPISGVLFSLEEVAYFFPAKTLFRTFFCSITAALTLKFLNPYGTNKIVLFEVRYTSDWQFFEIAAFILIGILGGAVGAVFIKASRTWARNFRPLVKRWPLLEVVLVALASGIFSFWNPLTRLSVAKLLYNLVSPCYPGQPHGLGICPQEVEAIQPVIYILAFAFSIKALLTIITFGIKVPAGIYVPSMVVGGIGGRIIGHLMQIFVLHFSTSSILRKCAQHSSGVSCITPGVYALIAAGSTMCGVTRLSVTLAVILFEITGSLDYVLPCSLAILVAKWTADAIEPQSVYDLITELNSYPLLDNKHKPILVADLETIVPPARKERVVDISNSPLVEASDLETKLAIYEKAGEFDGAIPIIQDEILVGLLSAPDLKFALDNLEDKANTKCLMTKSSPNEDFGTDINFGLYDITAYIDPVPFILDIRSPMDLVYQCFVKLGIRYISISREGRFVGTIHKKAFVHYIWEVSKKEGHI